MMVFESCTDVACLAHHLVAYFYMLLNAGLASLPLSVVTVPGSIFGIDVCCEFEPSFAKAFASIPRSAAQREACYCVPFL